jgi:hypothetical protein
MMIIGKDLLGSGRGLILRYYPGIRLEGLKSWLKGLTCPDQRQLLQAGRLTHQAVCLLRKELVE